MKITLVLVLAVLLLTLQMSAVSACSCFPTTVQGSYFNSNTFVRAKVVNHYSAQHYNHYRLMVQKKYRGCNVPTHIDVKSTTNCAACCIFLTVGESYIFPLSSNGAEQQIDSCQGIKKWSDLSVSEKSFLSARSACCGGICHCADNNYGPCIVAPCSVTEPPCEEAVHCVDNYCGGCLTDWFKRDGGPACLPSQF